MNFTAKPELPDYAETVILSEKVDMGGSGAYTLCPCRKINQKF
jgi:hypothetical protein